MPKSAVPPIDLIALDLDGTLLAPDESISARNRTAVKAALAEGIRVVLVTGRGVDVPIRVSKELGLNLPVICCHGALTKDFGANKTLESIPVPLQFAKPMIEFAERERLSAAVYVEEAFYRLEGSEIVMEDMRGPGWYDAVARGDPHRAPTFIRFLGENAVQRMLREFGDLPLSFKHESWFEFVECAVLNRDASRRTRSRAWRPISASRRSACSRSATRATTCRCCAGPASASRWPTRCPRSARPSAT